MKEIKSPEMTETTEMFADCFQVLSDLVTEYPVTNEDIIRLNKNKSTYAKWLKSGIKPRLEDEGDNQLYNGVLDKITAWMRIPTQSSAAQNIRMSRCKNVYVEFRLQNSESDDSGGFFTKLCEDHVDLAAVIFAEPIYLFHLAHAAHTRSFVQRVNVALRRMMEDWTPTSPVWYGRVRHLDSRSTFLWMKEKLSPLLLPTYIGNDEPFLERVYFCVGRLVGYLHLSEIMWTWNTAVSLMITDMMVTDKMEQVHVFIQALGGHLEDYDIAQGS